MYFGYYTICNLLVVWNTLYFLCNYKELQFINMNILVQNLSEIWGFEVCKKWREKNLPISYKMFNRSKIGLGETFLDIIYQIIIS